MNLNYADIDANVLGNIEGGTVENALYQLCRYVDFVEREDATVNGAKANNVQISQDTTAGTIRITISLKYTEVVAATGDLVTQVDPFLVSA